MGTCSSHGIRFRTQNIHIVRVNMSLKPTVPCYQNNNVDWVDVLDHFLENEKAPSPEDRARARSERKRCREKQRRTDVNTQFADLTTLLKRIDETEGTHSITSPMNRVDLISKTIVTLTRIHKDNKKRKVKEEELENELVAAKKRILELEQSPKQKTTPEHIMMMVPMMVPREASAKNNVFAMPENMFMVKPSTDGVPQFVSPAPFTRKTITEGESLAHCA